MMYFVEKFGPFSVAFAVAVALWSFNSDLSAASANNTIDFSNLYSAVFDWSAIQTGFLFGIFGYVGSKTTGFISEIKDSTEISMFFGYMKSAIWLGFIVTFFSIPLVVTSFKLDVTHFANAVFCLWSFLSVWAFFAFARVAYLFGLLVRQKDQHRIPA